MLREDLKKSIPYGYGKKIAAEAKVTPRSVSLFLSGKTNSIKIELAALKIIAELNDEKQVLSKRIQ